MNTSPKISIITISYNEAWSLVKTVRSVLAQTHSNIEYIVVDGGSNDGSLELCEFLYTNNLVTHYLHERDDGVYHAMTKGAALASGDYICFLNSGDVFEDSQVVAQIATHAHLLSYPDCLIGWGTVGKQIWATWIVDIPAVRMASLGFCHQALFVRREVFQEIPFRDYTTTDNDTYQMADIIASGKRVEVITCVIANRDPNPGLSAYSSKSTASVKQTLSEFYGFTPTQCDLVISFRREAVGGADIIDILEKDRHDDSCAERALHLSIMCLDTAYLRQAADLEPSLRSRLIDAALNTIEKVISKQEANRLVDLLSHSMLMKTQLVRQLSEQRKLSDEKIRGLRASVCSAYTQKPLRRLEVAENESCHVCITSFPDRIKSLDIVIRTILNQTIEPQGITIILGKDEFPSLSYIPSQLLDLCSDVVDIHMSERTHHNYDKLFLGVRSSRVAIFDDDVIYNNNAIEKLVDVSRRNPGCVVANRAHRIELTEDRDAVMPYSDWTKEKIQNKPSHLVFPTGAGGVLYDKRLFTADQTTNSHMILRNAPFADDVWLKIQSIMQGVKAVTTDACSSVGSWYQAYTPQMGKGALHKLNVDRDLNDIQFQACIRHAEIRGIPVMQILREETMKK